MQLRRPSRTRPGNTVAAQGETQAPKRVPRLPHERDESADSQPQGEASGRQMGKMAHTDLAQGRVDTDKGPPMGAAYDKLKR
ncbi:hypothetical protein [uncultured Ramlibacter sp.]|uniref:hypothetical protein n=1 Tax=uncultured Ramlibacter sp. TaxID=260755 RepID=UPI00261E6385|nr:hypothetical protein [uncultured Ramlibacter sp.]